MVALPYGSWPTPFTSELVVRSARTPSEVAVDHDTVWWSESRPEEQGRYAVMRRSPDGTVTEVLAAPWNARTAVHEYGGGAWWVREGVLWFTEWTDQRLYRLAPGDDEPQPITPEPSAPRGLRYADGHLSPDGEWIACVREDHTAGGEARNEIVRLRADAPSEPEVLVSGPDFVSDPRWSPDGASMAWLEWDHPAMPWDASRLVVGGVGVHAERQVVAGGPGESVCQPRWAPDGSLWFCSDRTGFWSLYRRPEPGDPPQAMVDLDADIGVPQWVFNQSTYAVLDDGRIVFAFSRDGVQTLALSDGPGDLGYSDLGYTVFGQVRAFGGGVVCVAASPVQEPHLVRMALERDGIVPEVLVPPRDLGVDDAWISVPEHVTFPTAGGAVAHALLYQPTNPEVDRPEGELPPLLVFIHGGPTAAARPQLSASTQYWTSRGFCVADVNYRGSTGYGRAYRDLLQGQWGVADVEDCVAVAEHLAGQGLVDRDRCCIRGGSAGGFTTLAALAFHDVFAAGASHYGVADLEALARETHKFESRYLDGIVGAYPEERQTYVDRSPIHAVERIDRPLAVFQGAEDVVVPPAQSEMIVDALRGRGVPVAYVLFEGEQHGFRQAPNIRRALDGELSFYGQVLGFDLPSSEDIDPIAVENV